MLSIVLIQDPHTGDIKAELAAGTQEQLRCTFEHIATGGKVKKIISFTPLELEGMAGAWISQLYARAQQETNTSLGLKALLTLTLTMIANGSLDVSHMSKQKKKGEKRGGAKAA